MLALLAFALALTGLASPTASAGDAQASRAATVGIVNFAFHPPTLAVAAGSKVVFANNSRATHTATKAGSFDTGLIKPGKSVAVTFKRQGTFPYHCTIHPEMHGKIVVS